MTARLQLSLTLLNYLTLNNVRTQQYQRPIENVNRERQ